MPCLIDPGSHAVREAGFSCVETYLGKLKEVSARMKVEEDDRRRLQVTNFSRCHLYCYSVLAPCVCRSSSVGTLPAMSAVDLGQK